MRLIAGPLIIGSGIAGSAVAITLARGGARPVLLERSRDTGDAICGGFLSWQSLAALDRLGLDAAQLGGQRVTQVRLFAGRHQANATLPQPGMGLSRRSLDTLLLATAEAAGSAVERGVTVRGYGDGHVSTADGATMASPAIFAAHGKYAVAGHDRVPPPRVAADPVIGLRQRISASPRIAAMVGDAVELFLFDRGYAGLVRQEDGSANLCLAVHKSRLTEAGGRPEALLAAWGADNARLGDRLAAGDAIGPIDAIAAVPYGWRRTDGDAGLWRLGDQAAVIPSLAGEGMGIALATAESAAKAWQSGRTADDWQRGMARRLGRPMTLARIIWSLAEDPRFNGAGVTLLRYLPFLTNGLARATRVPPDA